MSIPTLIKQLNKMKVLICDFCRKIPEPNMVNPKIVKISYSTGDLLSMFSKENKLEICDECFHNMTDYLINKKNSV